MPEDTPSNNLSEKILSLEKKIENLTEALATKRNTERRAAVLVDYENMDKNVSVQNWLQDFNLFIEPILDKCDVILLAIFVPEHMAGLMPKRVLCNRDRFFVIACPPVSPRDTDFFRIKDTDTVDARMDQFGKFLVSHCEMTDLVVVTGDGGFQELLKFGYYHRKKITLISPADAVSGRFILQENEFNLNLIR